MFANFQHMHRIFAFLRSSFNGIHHLIFRIIYVLCRILPLCIKEPTLANQFGTFIRLSLSVRERWLRESVGGGLHMDPAARNNALLYSESVAFANGVAVSI